MPLTTLPVEILEKIFVHLLALKPGRYFEDPLTDPFHLQGPRNGHSYMYIATGWCRPIPRPLLQHSRVRKRSPSRPAEIHQAVLYVCKLFLPIAERTLLSSNDFVFTTVEALDGFVAHVNNPLRLANSITPVPTTGAKDIRRLHLHARRMVKTPYTPKDYIRFQDLAVKAAEKAADKRAAYLNYCGWMAYFESGCLAADFPGLQVLELMMWGKKGLPVCDIDWDVEGVHPVLRRSLACVGNEIRGPLC